MSSGETAIATPRPRASSRTSSVGSGVVGEDQQRGAELDGEPLRVVAVADDDDVAVGDAAGRGDVHRVHPHPSGQQHRPRRSAARRRAPRRSRGRTSARPGGSRSGATRGCSGGRARARSRRRQRAVVVDDRDELELGSRHRDSGLADRLVLSDHREARRASRRTARTITCGRNRGSGAPLRSSSQRVCGLHVAEPDRDVVVVRVEAACAARRSRSPTRSSRCPGCGGR